MSNISSQSKYTVCTDSSIGNRLEAAITLWRKNSRTLGFFPEGAFKQSARNNWIIYLLEQNQGVRPYI